MWCSHEGFSYFHNPSNAKKVYFMKDMRASMLSHFSCVWHWDLMDRSPPRSSVLGILQARVLEWVTMPSSRGSSWPRDWTRVSFVFCIGRRVLSTSASWEAQIYLFWNRKILKVISLWYDKQKFGPVFESINERSMRIQRKMETFHYH